MYEQYLLIDYENVQDVEPTLIGSVTKVMIIVGEDQKKVPIDLVKSTQPFGESVEWIQVAGKGKNALDFFIAYYLEESSAKHLRKGTLSIQRTPGSIL